jgi:Histone methylation protein DOT1
MYGGMRELFIEESVVQPSRLGKSSDFLDIGSGIGQVVIQVACTVGCRSIGYGLTLTVPKSITNTYIKPVLRPILRITMTPHTHPPSAP